jgi:hypothetical protein
MEDPVTTFGSAAFAIAGIQPLLRARFSRNLGFFSLTQTPVTAVTDPPLRMGDTATVNMVRRACTKALFEPGDTRQQWKGEAAASFV